MKTLLLFCLMGGLMCACNNDVYYSQDEINTALRRAVEEGNVRYAKKLIKAGAEVNPPVIDKTPSPLVLAIEKNDLKMVKMLLKSGAQVNAETVFNHGDWGNKKTILFFAVEKNNVEIVRELIKAGAKNEFGVDLFSPLIPANQNGNREMVQELLKITKIRPTWDLQLASMGGQLLTVQELLKRDDVIKEQVDISLWQAVKHNHLDLVRELIKAGADVNLKMDFHDSNLVVAAKNDNREIFDELVKAGAQVTPQVRGEQLHSAINRMDTEEVKKLLEQDTDINLIREYGGDGWLNYCTPLSQAKFLKKGYEETLKDLSYLTDNPDREVLEIGDTGSVHIPYKQYYAKEFKLLDETTQKAKSAPTIIKLLENKGAVEEERREYLEY